MPRSRIVPLLRSSFSPRGSGFNGISNGGNMSHIQLRRGSAATSVSPNCAVPRGRRVPKNVRRAMVESYVAKYMALNSGKFPCAKHTQKEIGGSYYVIREILQELQSSSKTSSISDSLETPPLTSVDASSRKAKAVSPIVDEAAHETVIVGGDDVLSAKYSVMENMDKIEPVDSKVFKSEKSGQVKMEIEDEFNTSSPQQASANEHINEEEVDVKSAAPSSSSNLSTETDGKIRHSAMLSDNVNKLDEVEGRDKASAPAYSSEQESAERGNDAEVLDARLREKEVRAEAVQESERLETKGPDDVLKRDSNVRKVATKYTVEKMVYPEEHVFLCGGIFVSVYSSV